MDWLFKFGRSDPAPAAEGMVVDSSSVAGDYEPSVSLAEHESHAPAEQWSRPIVQRSSSQASVDSYERQDESLPAAAPPPGPGTYRSSPSISHRNDHLPPNQSNNRSSRNHSQYHHHKYGRDSHGVTNKTSSPHSASLSPIQRQALDVMIGGAGSGGHNSWVDSAAEDQLTDDEFGLYDRELFGAVPPQISVVSVRPPPRPQGLLVVHDPETVRLRDLPVGECRCLGVVPLDSALFLTLSGGQTLRIEFPPSLPVHDDRGLTAGVTDSLSLEQSLSNSLSPTGLTTTGAGGGGGAGYSRQLLPEGEAELRVDRVWTLRYRWEAVPRPILPSRDDLDPRTHAWCWSVMALVFPLVFLVLAAYCVYKLGLFGSETVDDLALELNTFTQFDLPFTLVLGFALVLKMLWDRLRQEWENTCSGGAGCCGLFAYAKLQWSRRRHKRLMDGRRRRQQQLRRRRKAAQLQLQQHKDQQGERATDPQQLEMGMASPPRQPHYHAHPRHGSDSESDLEDSGWDSNSELSPEDAFNGRVPDARRRNQQLLEAIERERSQALAENIQQVDWWFEVTAWADEVSSGLAAEVQRYAHEALRIPGNPGAPPRAMVTVAAPSSTAASSSSSAFLSSAAPSGFDPYAVPRAVPRSTGGDIHGNSSSGSSSGGLRSSAPLAAAGSGAGSGANVGSGTSSAVIGPTGGKGSRHAHAISPGSHPPTHNGLEWRSVVDDAALLTHPSSPEDEAAAAGADSTVVFGDPLQPADERKQQQQRQKQHGQRQQPLVQASAVPAAVAASSQGWPVSSAAGTEACNDFPGCGRNLRYPTPPTGLEDYRSTPWGQWGWADYRPIKVRGPTYLQDGKKIPTPAPAYQLVWVDFIAMVDGSMRNLASHPRSYAQNRPWPDPEARAGDPVDPLLVLTWIMPGNPAHNIGMYFRRRRHTGGQGLKEDGTPVEPLERDELPGHTLDQLLDRFMRSPDDGLRDSTLKFIPNVVDGSWIVKKTTGSRPAIIGKKLKQHYFRDHIADPVRPYFEVAIDVGSSRIGGKIMSVCLGFSKSLSIDLHFLIQGETEQELPEHILGGLRLHYCDVSHCPRWLSPEREAAALQDLRAAGLLLTHDNDAQVAAQQQSQQQIRVETDDERKHDSPSAAVSKQQEKIPSAVRR